MDGREGMAMPGSASYYLNRGIGGSGTGSGSIAASGAQQTGFKALSDPNPNTSSVHTNVRVTPVGSTLQTENQSPPNFSHGIAMAVASSVSPGDTGKKKRGRPRKYGLDGANMSLGLSTLSSTVFSGSISSNTPKKSRGRPPGSGRKQQLARLGEWMNSSAGLAFTPHVIHIGVGEDVAGKVVSFAQQRPRALCILSANGSVSAVTLREPTSAASTVTYEGRFEILCLSGSYLLAESGGPRSRTGGLSISVCSPDGHVIGGAIGGRLIAASPVQVVVCSFVYGGTKEKKAETTPKADKNSINQSGEKSTPATDASSQNATTLHSSASIWPLGSRRDLSNPHTEIDLTRG